MDGTDFYNAGSRKDSNGIMITNVAKITIVICAPSDVDKRIVELLGYRNLT